MAKYLCLVAAALGLVGISCKRNRAPVIMAAKAFPDELATGDSTDLIVSAADADNEPLKYKWTAKEGKLSKTNDSLVRWHAPDRPGSYKIHVVVSDKAGAKDERTLEVTVNKPTQIYTGSLGSGGETGRKARGEKKLSGRGRRGGASEKGEGQSGGRRRSGRATKNR